MCENCAWQAEREDGCHRPEDQSWHRQHSTMGDPKVLHPHLSGPADLSPLFNPSVSKHP